MSAEEVPVTQLPWTAIPKFIPGVTDVTEYVKKVQFIAKIWPKEHLSLLAPRLALLCEGTAFKKVSLLDPEKLRVNDQTGVELIVSALGGSWGLSRTERKYDFFERAIYGTVQKHDESNDSYLARHDVVFEELRAQGTTIDEVQSYVLLRQSGLSTEDRKRIVVECGGKLDLAKIKSSVRLLGSRVFGDLQGDRNGNRTKTYDANIADAQPSEIEENQPDTPAFIVGQYDDWDADLDSEYIEALVAQDDQDAMQVSNFEGEMADFFQETPELHQALVSYLEARNRLREKQRSRGFWPITGGSGSSREEGLLCKRQQREGQRSRARPRGASPENRQIKLPHLRRAWTLEGRISTWQSLHRTVVVLRM